MIRNTWLSWRGKLVGVVALMAVLVGTTVAHAGGTETKDCPDAETAKVVNIAYDSTTKLYSVTPTCIWLKHKVSNGKLKFKRDGANGKKDFEIIVNTDGVATCPSALGDSTWTKKNGDKDDVEFNFGKPGKSKLCHYYIVKIDGQTIDPVIIVGGTN